MQGTASQGRQTPGGSAPVRPVRLGLFKPVLQRRDGGTLDIGNVEPLPPFPSKITERLEFWAAKAPDRVYLGQRDTGGNWRTLTYSQTLAQVRQIAQALLQRGLSADRPVVVLSGNDIEQALLALASMMIGIPYAPISPAYSLMSSDFGKLRYILDMLTPGLVFANDGGPFGRALALVPSSIEIAVTRNAPAGRAVTDFSEFLKAAATDAVGKAHAKVGPDTVAKFLFTSGSTGQPKGVINTQRMMCANQAMLNWGMPFFTDEPPVVVDWLPWSHTFGSNHNFNMVLNNGGSFYIDEGNPTPAGAPKTARNLRDIAPTVYFNVPKGFEALLPFLRDDRQMRETFFSRVKLLFYAGAGLHPSISEAYEKLALDTVGEKILFITSLGSTETAPAAMLRTFASDNPGNIGLPFPGVDLKLIPAEDKLEARLRGPHITPGYWRQPALTAEAFDDEGYYKLGDALKFADAADAAKGLIFDGRLAEDFKLATGTWVSVGPLRIRFIEHCAPYVRDVVLAGLNRDDLTALVFPDVDACRKLCGGLAADTPPAEILADPRVRAHFQGLIGTLAARSTGSSTRVCRIVLLETPPSLDVGEATDKGSINQRAVLKHRAAVVDELYAQPCSPRIISLNN